MYVYLQASALRIANWLADIPDLMMSSDLKHQMMKLVPVIMLHKDPGSGVRYLAIFLGTHKVMVRQQPLFSLFLLIISSSAN